MQAAERYERETRQPGQRVGALGPVGLEVFRALLQIIDYKTGRLDPSIKHLCQRLKRSRDAVVRALRNLRDARFITWTRRYVETGAEGRGPQVHQTSNAYRVMLPAAAESLLGRAWHPAPISDDILHAREQFVAERDAMIAALPLSEFVEATIEDNSLGAILARLGAGIDARDQRESAPRTESC
ncbi:replication protein A [Novosphingobium sp. TCA1]|uniref:replication protein A n=1 Tax=Novosphingobium sp. TCA1 TaxID=2682474 RepID=UPI00135C633A|nr:replication protein A [Novosphingobium sp. TCA1]